MKPGTVNETDMVIVGAGNASLASLRGWMIAGNSGFKSERAVVWADIDKVRADMNRLSKTWTNPENVRKWAEFKTTLEEFRNAQAQAISNSAEEQPATVIPLNEAAPRAVGPVILRG